VINVPTILQCNICQVSVIGTEKSQRAHVATRAHVDRLLGAAIAKASGWQCPGPVLPFKATPLGI
jgi:hypothetical protein